VIYVLSSFQCRPPPFFLRLFAYIERLSPIALLDLFRRWRDRADLSFPFQSATTLFPSYCGLVHLVSCPPFFRERSQPASTFFSRPAFPSLERDLLDHLFFSLRRARLPLLILPFVYDASPPPAQKGGLGAASAAFPASEESARARRLFFSHVIRPCSLVFSFLLFLFLFFLLTTTGCFLPSHSLFLPFPATCRRGIVSLFSFLSRCERARPGSPTLPAFLFPWRFCLFGLAVEGLEDTTAFSL